MTSRFNRQPECDLRTCSGCGDNPATECWVDTTNGALCWVPPGWSAQEPQDERQIDLFADEDRNFDLFDQENREADRVRSHYGP